MATPDQAQHYVECECGKPAEYFCNPCDVQLCEPCITKHSPVKQHDMVKLHEKIAQIRSMIAKESRTLKSKIRPIYQKNLTRISSKILTVPRHFSSVRDKLTKTKTLWHKEVDDAFREFEKDVDQMEKDQMTTLQKQKDIFEEKALEIDKILQANNDVKNSNNPNILLKFESNTKNFNVPGVKEFNNPCFTPKEIDYEEMKKTIGSLETLQSFDFSQYEIKVDELENCVSCLLNTHSPTTVIYDTGFPQSPNNNRLLTIVPLSHDRLWVGGYSNELKLMDLKGHLLDTVTVTCYGAYIAFAADGHLIYSDYEDHTIKKISDDNTIQTLKSTEEWEPHGITSTTSGDILVCLYKTDQSLSKVVRYNGAGHVMQEIQYDANNQPLYDNPWCITVNKNNDVCTTNMNNGTLVVVDESGTFRFNYINGEQKYKNTGLNTLTTDLHGNILICDYWHSSIHVLDIDGHLIGIIAPQGLDSPRGICIVVNGKLCVGEVFTGKVKLIK